MDIPEALTYAKAGFDLLRSAIGLAKDVQGVLPAGDKKDAIGVSLAQAERQMQIAEAQIAEALGYQLCRRHFPPAPMIEIGHWTSRVLEGTPVRECSACGYCDVPEGDGWIRTASPRSG